jgi:hypothetical protein
VSSGITGITRDGHGKLIPIPSSDVEFEVEYRIEIDIPQQEVRIGRPAVEKAQVSVSLKPGFDESYLPEGMYQLKTERETWRIQKLGVSWELLKESVQDIMQTKLRVISPDEK